MKIIFKNNKLEGYVVNEYERPLYYFNNIRELHLLLSTIDLVYIDGVDNVIGDISLSNNIVDNFDGFF